MVTTKVDASPITLMEKAGVLFRVDVHCWWGQSIKCREGEINAPKEIIVGMKTLIDPKALADVKSYRGKGERSIKKRGFPYPGLPGVYFVPKAFVASTEESLIANQKNFNDSVKTLVTNYPKLKKEWKDKSSDHTKHYDESLYPSAANLESRFTFSWRKFVLSLPDEKSGVLTGAEYKKEFEKQKEEAKVFLDSTITILSKEFYKIVKSFRERVSSGKPIGSRTINVVREFAENFNSINITNHKELKSLVDECFGYVSKVTKDDFSGDDKGTKAIRSKISKEMQAVVTKFEKVKDERVKRALDF